MFGSFSGGAAPLSARSSQSQCGIEIRVRQPTLQRQSRNALRKRLETQD
jgi:hypothetical protein